MIIDNDPYVSKAPTASARGGNVSDAVMRALFGVAIEFTLREAS